MTRLRTILLCIFIMGVTSDPCFDAPSVVQNGNFMTHHAYSKISTKTLYDCAAKCLMSSICLSFNYNKARHICYLNDNNNAVADIVPSQDFIYSDISPWPVTLSGPCAASSCSGNKQCHVDRLHRTTCMTEFPGCGQPVDVTGSIKEYEGYFLSADVSYTCNSDYHQCHNKTKSICQSTGQWEDVTGLCGQFRWHSPAAGTDFYIPCGPSDAFHITINGTPTQNTVVNFDVASGNNLPYHGALRLNANGYSNVIAINSMLDSVFYPEIILNTMPLTLGQQFTMEISLKNKDYKLMVDGAEIHTLNERYPGMVPGLVRIYGDVSVQAAEYTV